MQTLTTSYDPNLTFATNKNLFVTASETIVFDGVPFAGYSKLSFTVTNFASSANSVSFTIYASDDGINYYSDGATLGPVAAGVTMNVSVTGVAGLIRVTATSAGTSNFDCYLLCVQ